MKCDGCGQTKFEEHTVDSSEICTVCGQTPPHKHQWEWDEKNRTMLKSISWSAPVTKQFIDMPERMVSYLLRD